MTAELSSSATRRRVNQRVRLPEQFEDPAVVPSSGPAQRLSTPRLRHDPEAVVAQVLEAVVEGVKGRRLDVAVARVGEDVESGKRSPAPSTTARQGRSSLPLHERRCSRPCRSSVPGAAGSHWPRPRTIWANGSWWSARRPVSIPKIPSGRIRCDSEHCDMIWIDDRDHESAVVDRWVANQVA